MPTTNNPNPSHPPATGGAAPAAQPGPCQLVLVPEEEPSCDFRMDPGAVKLCIVPTVGDVEFEKVRCNGQDMPGTPTKCITVSVTGRTRIDVVYVFSDPVNGAGELREACTNNTLLMPVSADNSAVEYVICTPKQK